MLKKINQAFQITPRFKQRWDRFKMFFSLKYWAHRTQIKHLTKQYAKTTKVHSTSRRIAILIIFALVSLFLIKEDILGWLGVGTPSEQVLINLNTLLVTAPIIFIIWLFRDQNHLKRLENQRKDTNLKEFQQLQAWATGNIDVVSQTGSIDNKNKEALQISALHLLRAYLKGEHGDGFRRGAYEIFASALQTEHQKTVTAPTTANETPKTKSKLCEQLNRIVEEEWFNLLINHDFPTATISLAGVTLRHRYLHHRDFNKALNLQCANLQGANLLETQLQGANLQGAQLQEANLLGTQLQGADLRGAQLQGADLWKASLQGADLWKANFQGADLRGAQLQGANLSEAQLQGANLLLASLQGANLSVAQLQGANLLLASLQGANLSGANLQGANLSGASLQGANFLEASLQGVCFDTEYLSFEQRIEQQIGKPTEVDALKNQYREQLKKFVANKATLIEDLETITTSGYWVKDAVKRIQEINENSTLDLNTEQVGSYDEAQAKEWIAEYRLTAGKK